MADKSRSNTPLIVKEQDDNMTSSPCRQRCGLRYVTLPLICTVTVVGLLAVPVVLPIYTYDLTTVGSDAFTGLLVSTVASPLVIGLVSLLYRLLWDRTMPLLMTGRWRTTAFVGCMYALTGVGITFACPPNRTPAYLQGILMTTRIPFTVLIRLLVLRKGLSWRRLGCVIVILIGVFIALEPQIWQLPGSNLGISGGDEDSPTSAVWPLIFTLSQVPVSLLNVLCERELKQNQAHMLGLITWAMTFQLMVTVAIFWVDFLPFFGMVSSFSEFVDHLQSGLGCHFTLSPECLGIAYKSLTFIFGFCLANVAQLLLIQRAEGAVMAMVVQSMVTPLATLFWTFVTYDVVVHRLQWHVQVSETTVFTLGGLAVLLPAVVLYNLFSGWDAQARSDNDPGPEKGTAYGGSDGGGEKRGGQEVPMKTM